MKLKKIKGKGIKHTNKNTPDAILDFLVSKDIKQYQNIYRRMKIL